MISTFDFDEPMAPRTAVFRRTQQIELYASFMASSFVASKTKIAGNRRCTGMRIEFEDLFSHPHNTMVKEGMDEKESE